MPIAPGGPSRDGVAGLAALSLGAAAPPAQADAIADFYKGKTVAVFFGFGFGGTYGKYAQMLRTKKVKFKSNEFTWLGTAIQSNATITVRTDSGVKSIAGLKRRQVIMAAGGKGSPTFLMPALIRGMMGAKFKIVTGYKGSKNMMLAMERGEAEGVSLTWLAWKSGRPDWFEGKKRFATTLVQIGYEKGKDLPNVPMLSDLVTTKADKAMVAFMSSLSPIGRGFVTPRPASAGTRSPPCARRSGRP